MVSIPIEFGQFQKLEVLHLQNNQLMTIPKEIANIKTFIDQVAMDWDALDLSHNPVTEIPMEVCEINQPDLYVHVILDTDDICTN